MESSEDYEKEKENNPHSQETGGTLITMGFVPASDKFRADTDDDDHHHHHTKILTLRRIVCTVAVWPLMPAKLTRWGLMKP
jgi:hypothetical protein